MSLNFGNEQLVIDKGQSCLTLQDEALSLYLNIYHFHIHSFLIF